jgi:hypothetical protein
VGRTITETDSDPNNFTPFTAALTDGAPEGLDFEAEPIGGGYIVPEAFVIFGDEDDPRIDLHGDNIDSYTLTLDSLTITNNADRTGSTYSYLTTFSAYGTGPVVGVPEPGFIPPLVGSGIWLLARRRQPRRS